MKIRTDFVTNSSSSSFVAITIKGKVFSKIISKYIDAIKNFFQKGDNYGKIEVKDDIVIFEQGDTQDGLAEYVPEKLSEIISTFSRTLSFGDVCEEADLAESVCAEDILSFLTELFENKNDVVKTIESVTCTGKDDFYGEFDNLRVVREFNYSEKDGEKFSETETKPEAFDMFCDEEGNLDESEDDEEFLALLNELGESDDADDKEFLEFLNELFDDKDDNV